MSEAPVTIGTCVRCSSPLEQGDLRCAICGLTTPEPSRDAAALAPRAKVMRCSECGAAIAYDAEKAAPSCAFCGAVMRLEEPVDPVEQAEWTLPFAVEPARAQDALRAWMRSLGFFRPSDLAKESRVASLVPLWWAAWIFDARANVTWAADSNAGSGRSAWAPHAGETPMELERIVVSASRGLTPDECHGLASRYDLASASRQPSGPPGAVLESFDVQRSAARRIIVAAIERVAATRLTQGQIPGSSFRNVHVSIVLRGLRTFRFGLPAYVLAYRYRDRVYRAIVHGQDARVVLGTAPYSIAKILLVIAAVLGGLGLVTLFAILAMWLASAH